MLLHDSPEDWVLASGQDRSVEDFVAQRSSRLTWTGGIGSVRVKVSSKERVVLSAGRSLEGPYVSQVEPQVSFEALVKRMIDADLERMAGF